MMMEDWVSVTTVLAVGLVSLLAYWIWKSQELFKTFENIGLPGPAPNFLVGNTLQLKKMGYCNAAMEWRKKFGKNYGIFFPRQPVMMTSDPEVLRDLMVKKFASFPNRAVQKFFDYKPWSDSVGLLRNDHWKHVRKQLSPTFSSGKLKKMMPAVYRVLENLDNYIKEKARTGEEVELKYVTGCYAMDIIAGAGFGIHVDSLTNPDDPFNVNGVALIKPSAWAMLLMIQFPWLRPILLKLGVSFLPLKPARFFVSMIEAAVKERRKEEKSYPDFLQLLVDAEKEGGAQGPVDAEIDHSAHLTTSGQWTGKGLTDDEVKGNGMVFFQAGFAGTSSALAFTIFHLAANPQALRKAQDEVDEKLGKNPVRYETVADLTYLDMCMNEAMRLNPSGLIVDREAAEDTELGGYPVKKGTKVMIATYVLHRDPDYWPQPEKFLPERHTPEAKAARHPFAFVPFGHGPRNCIGMRFAQLEIRMALATILQHCTPVLCDKSVYPPVVKFPQATMVAKDGMWVKFRPRD